MRRAVAWKALWTPNHEGLEHLLLTEGAADGLVLAFDEQRWPFRLHYRLRWDDAWRLLSADLSLLTRDGVGMLGLVTDGQGHWRQADGTPIAELQGCLDIDIWPTPMTNSFPLRRQPLAVGERRAFRMAWVDATQLTVKPQRQAYTRLADRRYLFESLDGSGFQAELLVDEDGLVIDYPGLFQRVRPAD